MANCDVFISYSWNQDPNGPGGSWAEQFSEALERDLARSTGQPPRIFLDQTRIQNGPLVSTLRPELESAKAFIAIVSDDWSRPDSWCRWELTHFRICGCLHPELPDNRISKVLLGPVAEATQLPGELVNSPEYRFYSLTGSNYTGRPNTFAVSELSEVPAYDKLLTNLTNTLKASAISAHREVWMYIADVSTEWQFRRDRLCKELRKIGVRPVCETRWPRVNTNQFEEEIGVRMAQATGSIHLLAPVSPIEGWSRTQGEMELEKALEVAERVDRRPLSIFLWSDKERFPAPWNGLLERALNLRHVDYLVGKEWEYSLSNIQTRISSQRVPMESDVLDSAVEGSTVFVQCLEEDRPFARTIRQKLQAKGHRVDFLPQPKGWIFRKRRRGEDAARQENYERYYRNSDGLLVLHGNGNATELWSLENCDAIRNYLRDQLIGKVRGVCLVPPEETKDFRDPDVPSFANYFLSRLEEFESQLPRRGQ